MTLRNHIHASYSFVRGKRFLGSDFVLTVTCQYFNIMGCNVVDTLEDRAFAMSIGGGEGGVVTVVGGGAMCGRIVA